MTDRRAYQREYMQRRRTDPAFRTLEKRQQRRNGAKVARTYRDRVAGRTDDWRESRRCGVCDGPMPEEKRTDAKHCSRKCQQKAYRQRKKLAGHELDGRVHQEYPSG